MPTLAWACPEIPPMLFNRLLQISPLSLWERVRVRGIHREASMPSPPAPLPKGEGRLAPSPYLRPPPRECPMPDVRPMDPLEEPMDPLEGLVTRELKKSELLRREEGRGLIL